MVVGTKGGGALNKSFRIAGVFFVICSLGFPSIGRAATPSSASLNGSERYTTWTGGPFFLQAETCSGPEDPACDHFLLSVELTEEEAAQAWLKIEIYSHLTGHRGLADFELLVYDSKQKSVQNSQHDVITSDYDYEYVSFTPKTDVYEVRVRPARVTPGVTYSGWAYLGFDNEGEPPPPESEFGWTPSSTQVSAEVPLNVVLVGFEPGEFDESIVLGDLPDYQKPGVLIPRGGSYFGTECDPNVPIYGCSGAETLVNHGRAYYAPDGDYLNGGASWPQLLPIRFDWKPKMIYAPSLFSSALFEEMYARSHLGTHFDSRSADYLTLYNSTRGGFRGPERTVAPEQAVRFIDAEAVEEWIAENSSSYLGFEAGKEPGVPGYTIFFINSFDSPEAMRVFPSNEYHHFLIDRRDPDSGSFHGIDWGRVWGGRYRFVMVDLGAAPNPYESETWGNRKRSVLGSAIYDPPIWEYRAEAPRPITPTHLGGEASKVLTPTGNWDWPQLQRDLARNVVEAASYLFFRSYIYEPVPHFGRYWLSATLWHDRHAEIPLPTNMMKLYDQQKVLEGLRSLVPYFDFEGDVDFRYLAESKPGYPEDQLALDVAKANGGFTYMDVGTAMDYVDANRDRFYRGGECFTNVPVLNVVVEKHFAWALPVIVAGIAPNRDGVPWGFLASVNDLTKWRGSSRDPMMEIAHPQVYDVTFSYVTVHEASHYLGLSHPHDTIGAVRSADGSPRYWDGFTWTFNSTAAPTTYSHAEMSFNVLDQESIARGHLSYYMQWSDYSLELGGRLFEAQGLTQTSELPASAQLYRQQAIEARNLAKERFASFDFMAATFHARTAWEASASYVDVATGSGTGATERFFGTKPPEGCV